MATSTKIKIKIDNGDEWLCCGECGHKLGKLSLKTDASLINLNQLGVELKCNSCKTINRF